MSPRGIGVFLITPGFVDTPLTKQNEFKMPALISADQAATEIIEGFARGDFDMHFPKRLTRWLKVLRLLPYALYFRAVRKMTGSEAVASANENDSARRPLSVELARVVDFFEHIDAAAVGRLDQICAEHAWFKDPFNEVRGIEPIRRIFGHMFIQVEQPRFAVIEAVQQGSQAFLTWDFTFRMKRFDRRSMQTIRGASHLRFAADGRVEMHRDCWDAAEELYEKLPFVGALMRWLKPQAG